MIVKEINIYPVKSTAPISLQQAEVEKRGLQNDRRWMIVDSRNNGITARQFPKLLAVRTQIQSAHDELELRFDDKTFAAKVQHAVSLPVKIWDDEVAARPADDEVNSALSEYLRKPVKLVYLPEDSVRLIDPEFAQADDEVSFADGFPILLTTEASLHDLNKRATHPVSMQRFRANIVIDGEGAYDEDIWQTLKIGELEFDVAKACDRCVLTTIEPETLEQDKTQEPLHTLMSYRRLDDHHVYFGQNLIARSYGLLKVGDRVIPG